MAVAPSLSWGGAAIAFRAERPRDQDFLRRLFIAGRWHERRAVPHWTDAQMQAFLSQQHVLQQAHYRRHYPAGWFALVLAGGHPAGRLVLDQGEAEWRLVDLALLPEWQGRGLGGALVAAVQERAAAAGRPVVLHVAKDNGRAEALYRRLGFADAGDLPTHRMLRWQISRK